MRIDSAYHRCITMHESIYQLIKLPDVVTLINALLGFSAILMVVRSSMNILPASILIVLAVMADGLDGEIARRLEYGILGEQLDSLADIVSFGVAPAVIAYALLSPQYHYFICFIAGAFVSFGILRLARFNITHARGGFVGLPITSAGLAVVLYILVFDGSPGAFFSYGLLVLMLFLSALMVSQVPYPKIQNTKIVGTMAILLVLIVLQFYLNKPAGLAVTAGANLIIIGLYILSPVFKCKMEISSN